MNKMKDERKLIESLVGLQYECYDKINILEKAGVEYDIFGNNQILLIALDFLGYPKDNTKEFGNNPFQSYSNDAEFDTSKRTDFINFFNYDYIYNKFCVLENKKNRIKLFTNWIFKDIERLIEERSVFFLNNPKSIQN